MSDLILPINFLQITRKTCQIYLDFFLFFKNGLAEGKQGEHNVGWTVTGVTFYAKLSHFY